MEWNVLHTIIAIFAGMFALVVIAKAWQIVRALVPGWRERMDRISGTTQRIWANRMFPPIALAVLAILIFAPFFIDRVPPPPGDVDGYVIPARVADE